jgi:ATP-dependent DNA helicase RecG
MAADLEKLEKILRMEANDHYQDRLVFRGLAAFISNWTRDSLKKQPSPTESRLIEKVAQELIEYNLMTVPQRSHAIQAILHQTREIMGVSHELRATSQEPKPDNNGSRTTINQPSANGSKAKTNGTNGTIEANKSAISNQQSAIKKITTVRPKVTLPPEPEPPLPEVAPLDVPTPAKRQAKASTSSATPNLFAPLTTVKGIGETYGKLLSYMNLHTIHDLLYHLPFRYDDFSSFRKINELMYGRSESIFVQVIDRVAIRTSRGKEIIEITVTDETGRLRCLFFNARQTFGLKVGARVVMSGKVEKWGENGICFKSPTYEAADKELLNTGRLVPVYSVAGPVKVATLRKHIKTVVDNYARYLPDYLPSEIRERHKFVSLAEAIRDYHFPPDKATQETARRRLAFDEFFLIQLGVSLKRYEWQEEQPGVPIPVDRAALDAWYGSLNFKRMTGQDANGKPIMKSFPLKMTGAQQNAIADILADLQKDKPMNRLLQGDVGSGKTVVGATGLLMAAVAGFQGALMAPTQILAEQHYQGLTRLFDQFNESDYAQRCGIKITLELLTGSIRKKDAAYQRILNGEVDIIIGTSAIIQDNVAFKKLGLVIIDEQHRFGVLQRKSLRGKGAITGANPHLLVMTATPIPRSLNLTVYGDLDLSLMREMPPGRLDIKTRWVKEHERRGAYNFIRKQIAAGHQAFVICPLVEESEKIEAKAAVDEHARLQNEVFTDLKVGLLHGQMKARDKDAIMHDFRDKKYDILVATSVIEVGIDIPNATVILIEGADRFGLAQLHQFRGRVGRGTAQSYCILMAANTDVSQTGDERLKAIEKTNDGFELAEVDLAMRGPGDFFGTRQSGVPDLRVAGPRDMEILEVARKEATTLFAADPGLERPEHRGLAQKVQQLWNFEGDLS